MNKAFAFVLLLGLLAAARPVTAQEQASKLEVYGGYDYVRFNVNANVPGIAPSATYNGNGGGGQLEYNANHWLGVVGDLSGFYATSSGSGAFAGVAFTYLFGAQSEFPARQSYAIRSGPLRRRLDNGRHCQIIGARK